MLNLLSKMVTDSEKGNPEVISNENKTTFEVMEIRFELVLL